MRVRLIVKATADSEAGNMSTTEELTAMVSTTRSS
mgnify:CR=1 FL=1|jgi:hypothetical protein